MPSWNELTNKLESLISNAGSEWLQQERDKSLQEIGRLRNGRQVIFYASAFLQKPQIPADRLQITHEDLNGLMSVMHGMDWKKGLTLLLHTPGGVTNAAESIVSYLWSKFDYIEVIVPTIAMSAGTMIALASDRIVMGRPSQLGPIDPQFIMGGRAVSAYAIKSQFEAAKSDIIGNPSNPSYAHLWAPILQSLGPGLLQEAINALAYSESMVAQWLASRMFRSLPNPVTTANATAAHFNDASTHRSHGRRIGRDEARQQNLVIEDLEANQALQEAVLTAYHLATITFDKSPATKMLVSDMGKQWFKNYVESAQSR